MGPAEHRRPPSWFLREEIGLAIDSGPSLTWVCSALAQMNKNAITQLGTAAPDRVTYPKNFADPRRRRERRPRTARPAGGRSAISTPARRAPSLVEWWDRDSAHAGTAKHARLKETT